MAFDNIILNVENNFATITFNRPKALNALNDALLEEFLQALATVEADEDIRVLILTGADEKSFVAGADINEIAKRNTLQAKHFAGRGQQTISRLQELPIPVIAAVNGFALGGGSEMALACDFIYASENAKFGFPEINLGIIPGFGGTQRMPRLVGANIAKEMIFTGKMISAQEAKDMGMVNKVTPPETLMEEVLKTAALIASKGKPSLRAAKQAINTGMNVDLASGLKIEVDAFALSVSSEDAKEGTTAFLEKRDAVFKGKRNG